MAAICAVTSLVAAFVGLLLAYGGNYPESTLNYHRFTGISTVVFALAAAWLLHRTHRMVEIVLRNRVTRIL